MTALEVFFGLGRGLIGMASVIAATLLALRALHRSGQGAAGAEAIGWACFMLLSVLVVRS